MGSSRFPVGKVLIAGISLIVLTVVNVVGFYVFNWMSDTRNNDSAEGKYLSYPEFSGTVKEIEAYDVINAVVEASLDTEKGLYDPDPVFAKTDSVEIGVERGNIARILVSGKSGERWFKASSNTYVFDSAVFDDCGNTRIVKGQKILLAYDANQADTYTPVVAIKSTSDNRINSVAPYIWSILIPSIVFFASIIFLMYALTKRKDDQSGKSHKGKIAFAVTFMALSVISSALGIWINTYLAKAKAAVKPVRAHAPVIYLYNDTDEYINVRLDLKGKLTSTYPLYDDDKGWNVIASPDGMLTDRNGKQYRFLFWEADLDMDYDMSTGFCVRGEDTEGFLDYALPMLGLNEQETADFISYWLPLMRRNPYNVVSFQTSAYTDAAKLTVSGSPDVVIRVNMIWYASDELVSIEPQELSNMNPSLAERKGFVVAEWGGEVIPAPSKPQI